MEVFGVAVVTKNVEIAGRRISLETGRVAEQANGAVIIRQGDTVVLSTAVMAKEPREGIDWFPLTCDYEEKLYAAGKIPGAFMRREGRPSETAILASRLTDRPLRPLFPEGFRLDVQVISTVLSVDQESDPTILSINGASTALVISDIPFQGPVGAVRMGYIDGKVVVNPPMSQMGDSGLDLVVAGTADAILMVEAGDKAVKDRVRQRIVDEGIRVDGRGLKDVRQITVEVGVLPRTHGSGLFTRGQTQALTIATLGSMSDQQKLDGLTAEEFKRFMHHYNFPPYSVGESRPLRGPGRREIGHGALAERALLAVIPPVEDWPYTIRLVSEILSSNGSTSMASVCGSTLALMDAGVPIKSPVAGIAMGLVTREGKFAVLTDIQGAEDMLGDMDFKVAGTRDGITALQMDIKIKGLTHEIMAQALEQAREARLFVLDKMLAVLPRPRTEMSNYAPRITTILINPDKIRDIIGKGGSMIRKITEETGAQIDVEDDGRVFIAAVDQEGGRRAIDWIKGLTDEVEVGKIYQGKVVRIMPFGAFVEVLPGQDGLVHISTLTDHGVERVEEVCNIGDEIVVKAVEVDSQGRLNLSRQAAIEELTAKGLPIEEKISQEAMAVALSSPPPPPREGGFRGGDRGGRNGGGRSRGPRRD